MTTDGGTVVSTDPSWKCWVRDDLPATLRMGPTDTRFRAERTFPRRRPAVRLGGRELRRLRMAQATTFGQNAQQDGEPNVPIWRRVKGGPIPDIADDAHWI